ncbi:MAG TPA: CBS domain-containing protein [Stellaceae bacterium]|nr:CBS domain-containing protein [Stellaceae bacterium]
MKVRELMTTHVVTVSPGTPVHEVAKVLLEHGISAVPVVDSSGAPLGMVSEGDLIGRNEADREARRDWWLVMLAEGTELNPEFLASMRRSERTARDVMAAPLVTVDENTEGSDVAKLLVTHRIKRVPVLRDGRITGIVSRADLLRELSEAEATAASPPKRSYFAGALAGLDQRFLHHHPTQAPGSTAPLPQPPAAPVTVEQFRQLMSDFAHRELEHSDEARRTAAKQRRQEVTTLIDEHVSGEDWRAMLHQAREAAEHGFKEFMLLRFPSDLCSDGGRAINSEQPDWPTTLRGEAAEMYLRWERELRPNGFHLGARVLNFPGGMPGDIGLFLLWGQ